MKVYVVYETNGWADTQVDKIFSTWDAAIQYRIKQYEHLKESGWADEKIKNHVMSEPCIDEFEVEGEQ
jgi:hypothetical protein